VPQIEVLPDITLLSAPVIAAIPTTPVLHGQTVHIDVPANTTGGDGPLTFSLDSGATYGYAYWDQPSQEFIYESSNSYAGPDSFTVKANDGIADSNIATININVTDQAPVIDTIATIPVLHGQTVSIDVPNSTTDGNFDPLSYSVVSGATCGYAYWDPSSQQFIYEASNSYTGPDFVHRQSQRRRARQQHPDDQHQRHRPGARDRSHPDNAGAARPNGVDRRARRRHRRRP
jgi:titin